MIKDIQDMKYMVRLCFMSSPDHEHDSSVDMNDEAEEYDEAQGYSWGTCRSCGEKGNCSNDDGYCTDCN